MKCSAYKNSIIITKKEQLELENKCVNILSSFYTVIKTKLYESLQYYRL